jgi:hypothetical protein
MLLTCVGVSRTTTWTTCLLWQFPCGFGHNAKTPVSILSIFNMSHDDQWGATGPVGSDHPQAIAPIQALKEGAPYDGGRFRPRTRIRDPIFLVIFIAQVGLTHFLLSRVNGTIHTTPFR